MNNIIPEHIRIAISELSKLPGIGPKTAQRLAFHLLKQPESHLQNLGEKIAHLRSGTMLCENCFILSAANLCDICQDSSRDQTTVCVVEHTLDVVAIEKTMQYKGLYHVLHGVISPIDGIGPADLRVQELIKRVSQSPTKEIILATNPSIEGETTALYLVKILKPFKISVTRIALGMPIGGELEYTDDITLKRALEGRREYSDN